MKTVLILGAIDSFCDLIRDFKNKGVRTVVCDYYEGAPGKKIADIPYDISTLDVDRLVEIGKEHHIDGVLCAFSDRNIQPCYEVADRLGLPQIYHPELIRLLTDKISMKDRLKSCGFPITDYKILTDDFKDDELAGFDFPVIIKPIDSSGSKGIFICKNTDEIRKHMPDTIEMSVNYDDRFIVEEYYPYDEISITAWVNRGKAYVTCVYDNGKNFDPQNPAHVSLSSVVFPSKYTKGNIEYFEELTQKVCEAFGVSNGPVTVQCFIGPQGLKVNEFICRLAGDSAYMCSAVMGAPAVADKTERFVLGEEIDCSDLERFSADVDETYYQIGVYVNKTGKVYTEFDQKDIMDKVPGCVRADVYVENGTEYKYVTTGGNVACRIYVKKDASVGGYIDYLNLLKDVIIIRDEEGNQVADFHDPDHALTDACYPVQPV